MTTIFVLIERGGFYDDTWSMPLAASHDSVTINNLCAEKTAAIDSIKKINECVRIHMKKWDEKNPAPFLGPTPELPKRTWPLWTGLSKNLITEEMRKERKELKAKYVEQVREINEQYYRPFGEYQDRRLAATRAFLLKNSWQQELLGRDTTASYSVEEIPLV